MRKLSVQKFLDFLFDLFPTASF